ncbi:hypothetical protein RDI58_026431 [Solanum bulbocastanum]|uniref:Uncharacterized protein n=1 Tax=Solanum bulbocastanum TaxID=147425 RepID=A0AAN8STQ9_SOLBU
MANDNILFSPSALLPEEQNVVAQPQHLPKPWHRPQKFKQIQDSSVSEKTFHSGNIISFGQSDPQGLFGSSGVSLQDNPKSLENLDKETSMYRPAPNMLLLPDHHITTNKEASAVIIKQESFVAPLIPEYTFRNEKQKLLEDAFAPTFSLMKLSYQQGMLSSSRLRFQENAKILEALDKERSMYHPGQTVLQSLEHHIAKNKEDGAVKTNCECLVPPTILEESLRKGKQKLIEESFPPTFPQMNVSSQLPSASLTNGLCPSRASQLNLLWLLQKQMQLSRTYEKLPAVVPDVRSIYTPEMCAQRLKLYMYLISFAPYPSTDEGTRSLNCSSPHATSPTSSTASSKRLVVHQADLIEPKRMKQMTNSGENSVLRAPTEPVLNQSISTTHPSSFIRPPIVQPSVIVPSSTTSVEHNEYLSSTVKVEQDLVTSQNLAIAAADASIDTKLVLDQNENIGKYFYGFETDGTVGKGYYMDQLENLNGASLFPGIHIEPPLSRTLMVNDTRSNNQQINDQLPYLNGKMDPIDDIQFE